MQLASKFLSSASPPGLTVIVPAFNESHRLADRANRLQRAVHEGALCARGTELIVVDDGSSDETAWVAEELLNATFQRLRVLRIHKNAGKGAAVRLGMAAASASVVLFMDADMAVDPHGIPNLVKAIGPADIAIGSRSLSESVVVCDGLQRKLMGRTFNSIVTALTGMPYRDTQCGFKAFRTPLARLLFHLMRVQRFAFDVEVLRLARQLKMEIAEVAVHWDQIGLSTVRSVRDPLLMVRDVCGLRSRHELPNLPALVITPAKGERRRSPSRIVSELSGAVGSNYPIAIGPKAQCLLLLPLCDPIEVQEFAVRLRQLPIQLSVRERSLSFTELTELTPFQWLDAKNNGLVVASPNGTNDLVLQRPTDGWQSMRTSSRGSNSAALRTPSSR